MKLVLFLHMLMLGVVTSFAQPTIQIRFNKTELRQGDTLIFEASIQQYNAKYGTLHAFVENANHNLQWKFRYPLENGRTSGLLVVTDSFPVGVYAFNMALRKQLVHVLGTIKDKKPPASINYVAVASNQEVAASTLTVDEYGGFQIPNLVFDEKATFIFSPTKKTPDNWLDIRLETPVDSAFFPLADTTVFITVGRRLVPADTAGYVFNSYDFGNQKTTLENVTVVGKVKTAGAKMVEDYAGGFFAGEGYLFDGTVNEEITTSISIFDYLLGKVPGLQIYNNRDSNAYMVHWRGFEPVYFVDGMETDQQGILNVATSEIAAIKVLRPPFYGVSMGSAGGAIAIFTKKGTGGTKYGNQFRFIINGYTPQEHVWQ
jgi:hypothetical protein